VFTPPPYPPVIYLSPARALFVFSPLASPYRHPGLVQGSAVPHAPAASLLLRRSMLDGPGTRPGWRGGTVGGPPRHRFWRQAAGSGIARPFPSCRHHV